ncbi:MAG TPA: hemerythrin domain-containing protein [Rhizomicrobium sp.]|nr:hemerythrin domain-containing protein [Rhizomicrobium sp.]
MTVRTTIEQATKSVIGALTPGEEGATDILDTLGAEHDEVQELMKKLTDSESASEQKALVQKVKKALIPHSKAEEQMVYDPIAALTGEKPKVDSAEGYTEHALASATLKQLDTLTPNTPEFKASAKVLKELLDHHIKEEETNIWSDVKKNFSTQQRARMNREYLAAKKQVVVT